MGFETVYDNAGHAGAYGKRAATTRAELRVLRRLLAGRAAGATILDVPCGNGRLTPFLRSLGPSRICGGDAAFAMVRNARAGLDQAVATDALHLPFAGDAFDIVLSMRLLHHFREAERRRAILEELARVSRRYVLVSYYSAATLEGLRRRLRPKRASGRVGVSRRSIREDFAAAGLRDCRIRSLLPLVREQTLVLGRI